MTLEVAEIVTRHWVTILGIDGPVDGASNFFVEGGDSLAAVELVTAIGDEVDREIPLEPIFFEGTLSALIAATAETLPT